MAELTIWEGSRALQQQTHELTTYDSGEHKSNAFFGVVD